MANKHASLDALFADIANAIREKIGDEGIIPAVEFPNLIRDKLEVVPTAYLTFTSPNAFSIATSSKTWDGTIEYSLDKSTWNTWNGTELSADAGKSIYLRGTGHTIITGNSANYKWVLTGSDISCIGNIENLLDYATVESGTHPTMAPYCYYSMFNGCTSLTSAPALPATTLAGFCYSYMFKGCTGLTSAPALPATTLANYCYNSMFKGCTGLAQAPALPATTLSSSCYSYMFNGCTNLTTAPSLPATTLSSSCYSYMFNGCTSLTAVPSLPATKLAPSCYSYMFASCTSIKLAISQSSEYDKEYRIPKSGDGVKLFNALNGMFRGTGGTFTGTPEINTTYYTSNTVV